VVPLQRAGGGCARRWRGVAAWRAPPSGRSSSASTSADHLVPAAQTLRRHLPDLIEVRSR
jgi:hypothetical protein